MSGVTSTAELFELINKLPIKNNFKVFCISDFMRLLYRVVVIILEAFIAFCLAASTVLSLASATPIRRCPCTSGLPNNRICVSGNCKAFLMLLKIT